MSYCVVLIRWRMGLDCRDLKEHLRRLQQQMESRRRVAVMEMMRQRAAEAAGSNS
jgi:E1A/CREB-binding protein